MTSTPRTGLLANTAIAFVLAAIINSLLHELAHATAGLVVGLTPTVTPFAVEYQPTPTDAQGIITAAAGPVWSLIISLVLMAVSRSWGSGFVRLFWLWLSFMGVMNFAGYLIIAGLVPVGDTGRALTLLGAPGLVFALAAVAGVALQFALGYGFARQVKRYAPDIADQRTVALRAWALGTGAILAVTLIELAILRPGGAAVVAVTFYGLAVGIFAASVANRAPDERRSRGAKPPPTTFARLREWGFAPSYDVVG